MPRLREAAGAGWRQINHSCHNRHLGAASILNAAGPLSAETAILGSAVEVGFGGMKTHSRGEG
jgi:hypothetical protein